MEGHAHECVERCCALANKKTEQFFNVSSPCVDDHHFKKEELGSVVELSTVCSQIVSKCSYLARNGFPNILWSVNKLARSVTEWTKACGRLLARSISYIHHTSDHTDQHCQLGLFQDPDFAFKCSPGPGEDPQGDDFKLDNRIFRSSVTGSSGAKSNTACGISRDATCGLLLSPRKCLCARCESCSSKTLSCAGHFALLDFLQCRVGPLLQIRFWAVLSRGI